ncbi:MAG: response regulator transcription factor [Solirubrobacteraceae bacterium]
MNESRLIRVVVADDHPAVSAGLCALLEAEPEMEAVGVAVDGFDLPALIHRVRPDVVVLDYQLPGENGLMLCRDIKRAPVPPGVILYSAFVTRELLVPARIAGVDAIVDKGAPPRELVVAIHRVAAGESLAPKIDPDMLTLAGEVIAADDLPILGMLANGTSHADMASTLDLSPEVLDQRITRTLACLAVGSSTIA